MAGMLLFAAAAIANAAPGGVASLVVEAQEEHDGEGHGHLLTNTGPEMHAADRGHLQRDQAASPPGEGARGAHQKAEEFPYTYVGSVGEQGAQQKIVLERNSKLFVVGLGAMLAGAYEIRGIHPDGVEVFFFSTRTRQLIPYSEIARRDSGKEQPVAESSSRDDGTSPPHTSRQQPKAGGLEDLMDLRPPGEDMETQTPSPRGDMVALPPSEEDVRGLPKQ